MTCWTALLSSAGFPLALPDSLGRAAYLVGLGLLVLLGVGLSFARSRALYGGGGDSAQQERVNCPSCGARTHADSETCEYCGEPIG